MNWQFADAKNKLSEVMTLTMTKGPQIIRRRDEEAVLMSRKKYDTLTGKRKSFTEFLLNMPDISDLDLTRDKSLMRDVEL